jgi:competence protein ComEC
MLRRSLGHRAPLLWLALPYALGLVIAKTAGPFPLPWVLGGALAAVGLAGWAAGRHRGGWAAGMITAATLAGIANFTLHLRPLPVWQQLPPREAQLTLRVDRVFPAPDPRRASGLATVTGTDAHLAELSGQKIYFSIRLPRGEPPPLRSTRLRVLGVLEALPAEPAAASFEAYLADAGMTFRLGRGQWLETVAPASRYRQFCARMLARFETMLGLGVAAKRPEVTGVLRAMLLGQKQTLSEEQETLFRNSGTMHLFAISGLHIGVIAAGLHAALSLLRLPRPLHHGLSLGLLWLYVDITGGTPSAVRAFIMVAVFQAAFLFRRPGNPVAALATSALIVLLIAPLQLFGPSFQMSYGIVAALLLLGLPLADRWLQRWQPFALRPKVSWRWPHHLVDRAGRALLGAVAIGVASITVSAVTGIQFFQLFTPGALLANLILIPAAIVVILGGMAALFCGLVGFTAGSILCNHASGLVLVVIDRLVRGLADLPGAYWPATYRAPWVGPAALAALLAVLLFTYARQRTAGRFAWWPPLAVVALTLIFGVKFG